MGASRPGARRRRVGSGRGRFGRSRVAARRLVVRGRYRGRHEGPLAVYEARQDENIQFYTPVPVPYQHAVEAARALCDWSWATLDVHRIEWWAMVGNTGSRAVAEKLGLTVEGTLRNRSIANGGKPHDWWVGGLLRP
ncbi:GNAT family N-acetyltransferase [Streptomyces sp. SID335]|nr:GNAT family N-acetyltransferase [Streptomyces sp. SID335]MYZ15612.1 GNAT family N-acetyltransferase [Streptomyces sp. SID337]NDZ92020.1 GNAT family N-acetyltransferase [Streptomyces sp. SID10115]NEA03661.1 GNAT family N-acetyltransferase [Streptomyces sp. SID10116]NEB50336.1 GNAT family N-acetyltransferase [Streptomyces sp. SID339]